jgi:hypothetical protein
MAMPALAPEVRVDLEMVSGREDPELVGLLELVPEPPAVVEDFVVLVVLFDEALKRAANCVFLKPDNGFNTVAFPVGLYATLG